MEKNEFTGFSIPDDITDPEEREFLELVNRITTLAHKKEYTLMLLTRINESKDTTIVMGCLHCIEVLLDKIMKKTPQFMHVLLSAIIRSNLNEQEEKQDTPGKDPGIKQLIDYAKKNTPAGN